MSLTFSISLTNHKTIEAPIESARTGILSANTMVNPSLIRITMTIEV